MSVVDIIGNNVGAMIAAVELSKKEEVKVRLFNELPFWGSHLVGTKESQQHYDFGRIIFDFFSYNDDQNSEISSYNAKVRNDVGRFYSLIRKYIEELVDVVEIDTPQMYYDKSYYEDFMFADSLAILKHLPQDTQKLIIEELRVVVANNTSLHASNKKLESSAFVSANTHEVSIANHGKCIHELLIAPFMRKVLATDRPELSAIYHRIPWLPLYYPETLLSQFEGKRQQLAKPKFHYPTCGYFSILIHKLKETIENSPFIELRKDKIEAITPDNKGFVDIKLENETIHSNQLVWSGDPEVLLRKLGERKFDNSAVEKLPISFSFVEIDTIRLKKEFSILTVIDENLLPFRITNQTYCSGSPERQTKLVVECNPEQLINKAGEEPENQYIEIINNLIQLQIIETADAVNHVSIKNVSKTIRIPNKRNELLFNEYDKLLSTKYSEIIRMGTSLDFVSISINDQIIQGLHIAEKYG